MVNKSNLEDSASVGVAAAILVASSLVTVFNMIRNAKHFNYPPAQYYLYVIFSMPALIGWLAWVEMLSSSKTRIIDVTLGLFKMICIVCFFEYMRRLLGREGSSYSSEIELKELITDTPPKCKLLCFSCSKIMDIGGARDYMWKIKMLLYQYAVAVPLLLIIALIVIFIDGDYDLDDSSLNNTFTILQAIKAVSTMVSLVGLINYGMYIDKIPSIAHIGVFHKLAAVKLGIFFTEIQPLIITLFASRDLITDDDNYSEEEVVIFTNSLLLTTEMALLSFLLVVMFPMTEYDNKDSSLTGKINPSNS
jgi:Organic solute transporter Ostalpha